MHRFSLLPLVVACVASVSACGNTSSGDCSAITPGIDQDVCYGRQLKATPAAAVDEALRLGAQIRDPMVKGEAVSSWVESHANEIPPDQGRKLCELLEGRDGAYCLRRLSSPHLLRN